jgi:TolB-like protein/Tfp pilus assembly protein PilF
MQSRIRSPAGEVHIEPRAMDVLVALARRPGEAMSRDELILAVWKHPHVTDEALSRCISLVRHALGDDRERSRFVETIPKRGYRLIAPVVPGGAAREPGAAPVTLAVLPFVNLSGDPADEHLADGVTELLITNLACLPSLRVISRTSSMHYKSSRARLTEIARELGVGRIVEGSVLHSAPQVQVVVQLIDPQTDTHLATRSYTRQVTDVLKLQNEIAWTIAEEIGGTVQPAERERLPKWRPLGEIGMMAFLRARHFWAQRTPEAFAKAMREYEACIAAEPDYAPAYAGLADTLTTMALYGVAAPGPLHARAKDLADRAIALDSTSAETLTTSGAIAFFFEWDFAKAQPLFRRAIAANPSYDIARLCLGDLLLFSHDFDSALRELHAAVRLNPFDLGLQMNYGQFLVYAGRRDEGVAQLRHTLDIGPHFWPARCILAETFALAGDGVAAKRELERASEDIPVARNHQPRAMIHAALGEEVEARALLAQLEQSRGERYVPPFELARGYAMLQDADASIKWIDIGIEERGPSMLAIDTFPGFDRIRDDPRFPERLARVGLPN